jgi:hypothetical protein
MAGIKDTALSSQHSAISQTRNKQALGSWPLAFSQTNLQISVPPCLRPPRHAVGGGFSIGGRP